MPKRILDPLECKTDQQKRVFLIERFIGDTSKINWGAEVKMAKKLLSMFGWDFLLWSGPPFKIGSLVHMLTPDGIALTKMKRTVWESQKRFFKNYDVEKGNEKFGEDSEIKNPIKNIAAFLKE